MRQVKSEGVILHPSIHSQTTHIDRDKPGAKKKKERTRDRGEGNASRDRQTVSKEHKRRGA
jgi:hypothetical protein